MTSRSPNWAVRLSRYCAREARWPRQCWCTNLPHESGASVRGPQLGREGNTRLHTVLYRAAVNAARFSSSMKAFYERLWASGEPAKVVCCAAARRLLLLLYTVVRNQENATSRPTTELQPQPCGALLDRTVAHVILNSLLKCARRGRRTGSDCWAGRMMHYLIIADQLR